MTKTLASAALAIICAAGHPIVTSVAPTLSAAQNTAIAWDGRWQGTTVSGAQLVLQIQVQGQRLKGRLIVGKQSANITEGKVVGDTFAITTGAIDGNKVAGTGRHLGDAIELTIEGVKAPLMLTRVK